MKLAVYSGGEKVTGLGHLARMRTLIEDLDAEVDLYTATPEMAGRLFDGNQRVSIHAQHDYVPIITDNHEVPGADICILDPPYYPKSPTLSDGPTWQPIADFWYRRDVPTVRFVDEAEPTSHNVSVLINGNASAGNDPSVYSAAPDGVRMQVLLGPSYFLVDRAHLNAQPEPNDIFVCFGGSDHTDLLIRFAETIRTLADDYNVTVVVGAASEHAPDLGRANFIKNASAGQIAGLLKGCGIAVTAVGNLTLERIFHNRPGISLAQFERQDILGRKLADIGTGVHLGMGSRVAPEVLLLEIRNLISDPAWQDAQINACHAVDFSAGRAAILKIINQTIQTKEKLHENSRAQ